MLLKFFLRFLTVGCGLFDLLWLGGEVENEKLIFGIWNDLQTRNRTNQLML